jgi:hypothetical protein
VKQSINPATILEPVRRHVRRSAPTASRSRSGRPIPNDRGPQYGRVSFDRLGWPWPKPDAQPGEPRQAGRGYRSGLSPRAEAGASCSIVAVPSFCASYPGSPTSLRSRFCVPRVRTYRVTGRWRFAQGSRTPEITCFLRRRMTTPSPARNWVNTSSGNSMTRQAQGRTWSGR